MLGLYFYAVHPSSHLSFCDLIGSMWLNSFALIMVKTQRFGHSECRYGHTRVVPVNRGLLLLHETVYE